MKKCNHIALSKLKNLPSFAFNQSTTFCGTGVLTKADSFLFCSSTDRMAPIFSIQKDDKLHVSNSAVFVMTLANVEPHPHYPFYNHDILRIYREGLYNLAGKIKLSDRNQLRMHVSTIMAVKKGSIDYLTYPASEEPRDFEHYHKLLKSGVRGVLENGQDSRRQSPLKSAAAISTGYDSCATATLAMEAGCEMTHTFYDDKNEDPHVDSGAKNAAALGIQCREYDRWAYLRMEKLVEAEFCLTSAGACPTLAAMEKDLRGSIYIVGSYGEIPWGKTRASYFEKFSNPWGRSISNISQVEFRLRIGCITFAPALIALHHNQAIANITTSEEMKPWSVNRVYDRPIARRICESAGIPRKHFGIAKFASGHNNLKSVEAFSPAGYTSYTEFLNLQKSAYPTSSRWYWKIRFHITCFVYFSLLSSKRKSARSSAFIRRFPYIVNSPPQRYPWKFAFTFQWSFHELKSRYFIRDASQK